MKIRNLPERKTIIDKRVKKPDPRRQSMQALYEDIDAGYRHFWKRRSGVPHLSFNESTQ